MTIIELLIILGAAYLVLFIFFMIVLIKRMYQHTFIGVRHTNGAAKVFTARAREIERDGIAYWKMLNPFKLRRATPRATCLAPPDQARMVGEKGNWVAQGDVTENDEVKWIEVKHGIVEPVLSDAERSLYRGQIRKAEAERGKPLMELVIPGMFVIATVIILISLMIFWGDLAAPAVQANQIQLEIEREQTQQYEILKEVTDDIQIIKSAVQADAGGAPN